MEQGWLRMEMIDTDYKTTKLKKLAELFKLFNRDWAPLTLLHKNSSTQKPTGIKKCNHPRYLACYFLREGQTSYTFLTWEILIF